MITLIITLSAIIYFLSVGFWSTLLIIAGESIKDNIVKIMMVAMFIPVVNTGWAFFIIIGAFSKLISDKLPGNG
jgi:hypothetical protein